VDLRVFICEDVDGIHFFFGDLFQTIGGLQEIGAASTEGQAKFWLVANQADWDIAIVDLVLDEGSGFGVIQAAKQTHPAGRVVVFSNFVTPTVSAHCISLGADAVFAKSDATGLAAWLGLQVRSAGAP